MSGCDKGSIAHRFLEDARAIIAAALEHGIDTAVAEVGDGVTAIVVERGAHGNGAIERSAVCDAAPRVAEPTAIEQSLHRLSTAGRRAARAPLSIEAVGPESNVLIVVLVDAVLAV